ncbi:MAG: hypothetical protein RL330_667, partial [Actinomycetota bacterium]
MELTVRTTGVDGPAATTVTEQGEMTM